MFDKSNDKEYMDFSQFKSSNGLIIDSKNSLKNELHPLLHGSVLELLPCQTGPGLAYKFLEMSPTGNVLQPLTDSDSNVNKILTTIDKNAQDLIINSVRNHLEQLDVSKLTETSCTKEEVTQVKDSDATNKFAKFLESHLTCVICSDVFIEVSILEFKSFLQFSYNCANFSFSP